MLSVSTLLRLARSPGIRYLLLLLSLPPTFLLEIWKYWFRRLSTRSSLLKSAVSVPEKRFPAKSELERILQRIGGSGARTTGGTVHNELLTWLEGELGKIPGLEIQTTEFEILSWETTAGLTLKEAGTLRVGGQDVPIAGAVPFSLPTSGRSGPLMYCPPGHDITESYKGKIVIRDVRSSSVPYNLLLLMNHYKTSDLNWDLLSDYERVSQAGEQMGADLKQAGDSGVTGLIFLMDLPEEQIESYFEPHDGTHWKVPAVLVGAERAEMLRGHTAAMSVGSIEIKAQVTPATTRNIKAILPGRSSERVIYVTHTDGNTFVQENGAVGCLTLAQYFSTVPQAERYRSIEFALTSGHLHMSREGNHRLASSLDEEFDRQAVTAVIAMEHLGAREVEAFSSSVGPGRELKFSGRGEMMLWCVGPSPVMIEAVRQAVIRRGLDRTLVCPGVGFPDSRTVPEYHSFGGIGGAYHERLLPTASIISGPWSLWAPSFGRDAVDVGRMRAQILALGDIYYALEDTPRDEIVQGYLEYRAMREQGVPHYLEHRRPERLE